MHAKDIFRVEVLRRGLVWSMCISRCPLYQNKKHAPIRQFSHTMKRYHLFTFAFVFVILFSSAAFAERLAVSVSIARIHSSPNKSSDILRKVKKYYPLLILKKSGDWLKFSDYEGDEGWIHQSLVSEIPTVITKTTDCNIRSAPSIFHRKLATVGKGIPFKVTKEEGDWLKVEHSGGFIGWIHKSLVW